LLSYGGRCCFHGYCQAATLWFLRSSRIGSMVFHESEGLGRASSEGEHHTAHLGAAELWLLQGAVSCPQDLQIQHEEEPLIENLGNAGHPNFCIGPCRFFARGVCESGDMCNYCHLPHQGPKLDKRQRNLLKRMPKNEGINLLSLSIQLKAKRAQRLNEHIQVQELLQLLHTESRIECANELVSMAPVLTRQDVQGLKTKLAAMSLPEMMGCCNVLPLRFEKELLAEVARLRGQSAAKGLVSPPLVEEFELLNLQSTQLCHGIRISL
ncbi:unnamed protein product, partial [Durusdinium trenchii]